MAEIGEVIRGRLGQLTGRDIESAEADRCKLLEKRMCSHVAWALLIHTVLIVLVIGHNVPGRSGAMLGQMVIVAMIALFILIARHFHYRWQIREAKRQGPEAAQSISRFQRDLAILWVLALGLPFFWLLFT